MKLIKPTKIDEYQETNADKIIESVFIIGLSSICIILVLLILFTTRSQAAGSNSLPLTNYTAPTYLTDEDISNFNSIISGKPSLFGNHIVDLSSEGIICVNVQLDRKAVGQRQYEDVMGYVFYKPYSYVVTVSNYDNFNLFSSDTLTFTMQGFECWMFWHCVPGYSGGYQGWMGGYQSQGNSANLSLFGLGNSVTITNTFRDPDTFIQGYPIYWSSPFYNGSSSLPVVNQPILAYGRPSIVSTEGHASEPDLSNDDINTGGHAQTPSTPTFPTMPSVTLDLTNVESLLESIFNLVKEFADFVGECFSVFFSWLVDVINNALQNVINNIKYLISFLYDNLVSLFQPLIENVKKITDFFVSLLNLGQDSNGDFSFSLFLQKLIVPDPADLVDIIEENDEYNLIGIFEFLNTAITAFKDTITNNTRKYITIPQCTFMGVSLGPYQIDFSWYDDYKVYGDGVISAILIFGYLFFLYTRISGILNHEGNSANKAEGGHL